MDLRNMKKEKIQQPFPSLSDRFQIQTGGVILPHWSRKTENICEWKERY
jgi:hypothetical protein